jgi:hypothetical protein
MGIGEDSHDLAYRPYRQWLLVALVVGNGATIVTSGIPRGGRVILNMLWRDEIESTATGSKLPVGADDWGRITIDVPPNTPQVRVDSRPPWKLGWLVSMFLLLCALGIEAAKHHYGNRSTRLRKAIRREVAVRKW